MKNLLSLLARTCKIVKFVENPLAVLIPIVDNCFKSALISCLKKSGDSAYISCITHPNRLCNLCANIY